jgi:hypothetical protein
MRVVSGGQPWPAVVVSIVHLWFASAWLFGQWLSVGDDGQLLL